MSELQINKLDKYNPIDHGKKYLGVVEAEDREVDVVWIEPNKADQNEAVYIFTNGWTGAMNSMQLAAGEAAAAGYQGVIFDYTNTEKAPAIAENVKDAVAVANSLPRDVGRRAIGLSMGGRVLTEAIPQMDDPLEIATLVASAGFLKVEPSYFRASAHFIATTPETIDLFLRKPLYSMQLGSAAVHHFFRRHKAIVAELQELVTESVHDIARDILASPNAPYMRFLYGDGDTLMPMKYQRGGIEDLDFDHVEMYKGGHLELVKYPALSRYIYKRDKEVPKPGPDPRPANYKIAA